MKLKDSLNTCKCTGMYPICYDACTSVFLWSIHAAASKIAIKLYACRPSSEWLQSVIPINQNYFLYIQS